MPTLCLLLRSGGLGFRVSGVDSNPKPPTLNPKSYIALNLKPCCSRKTDSDLAHLGVADGTNDLFANPFET